MIRPAQRLDPVAEYYFAAKLREIAALQQAGHPVLNLGIGSPDLPPHPDVIAALNTAAHDAHAHGYQPYAGIAALRAAWSDWYARFYEVQLDPGTEVLPLLGSKEGIVHLAMAFLEPGDIALAPNPGYPAYRAATLLAGATLQYYDLSADKYWLPDLEILEKTDLRRVKVMWVNYPHMPTGASASPEIFQQLVHFGLKHNILIVNDNPYSFILNDKPVSLLAAEGAGDIALELNSLSKSHNLAGWRAGMIAGKAEYLKHILRFKSNLDSGQFLPIQRAATVALGLPDSWYAELNATYRTRQHKAFELLATLGCTFETRQQGLFAWGQIPGGWREGFELSDALLREARVFATPGGIFGEAGTPYLRVSLCQPESVFEEAIRRVQTCFTEKTPAV